MLSFYRRATDLAGPALRLWLRRRVRLGKEAPARLGERFGQASLERPKGRLIWLHVAILGESELWPNLIEAARQRVIPLALVNARMSPRSLGRWRLVPASARRLLGAFALLLAADDEQAERLAQLAGRNVATLGNLKRS